MRPNEIPASYTELHQAILTGFLGSIGNLHDRREYAGPRAIRFIIALLPCPWIFAALTPNSSPFTFWIAF